MIVYFIKINIKIRFNCSTFFFLYFALTGILALLNLISSTVFFHLAKKLLFREEKKETF